MKGVYVIILVAAATLFSVITADDSLKSGAPDPKLISTFQIVRFPNEGCTGSSTTRNGTCYTSAECADKGGTSSGSCADGFGVCCTFTITSCGESSSENITYWDAPATIPTGACKLEINPMNDNICQLRLDFLIFSITGPSTASTSEINIFGSATPGGPGLAGFTAAAPNIGNAAAGHTPGNGLAVNTQASWATNCLVDSFSISSPNPANHPPVLCGVNTGFHMYVDMEASFTNVLSFIFEAFNSGPTAVAAQNTRGVLAFGTRDWDMTISQYECGYVNAAPPGCTQYFWADTGVQVNAWITSYNFQTAGSKHLANQNQKVCIRRERNACWASFYKAATGVWEISGRTVTAGGALVPNSYAVPGQPCGYAGESQLGIANGATPTMHAYDCIIMPGVFAVAISTTGGITLNATPANVQTSPRTVATNHSPAYPQLGGSVIFGGDTLVGGAFAIAGETGNAATFFTQHVPFQMTFKSDGFEGTGTGGEHVMPTNSVGMKLSYDLIPCSA